MGGWVDGLAQAAVGWALPTIHLCLLTTPSPLAAVGWALPTIHLSLLTNPSPLAAVGRALPTIPSAPWPKPIPDNVIENPVNKEQNHER